ncbi:response regulator [Pedobacter ureilyticus]|uniref:Response regulator n=1 Tax=Pedobacter ureilyticus TaxID=1393051 RepID=A0ABW9J190_9SPHI|nr:response regulator [Pedobacter helvus]
MTKRILVIEDDPDILYIIDDLLTDEGFFVLKSQNGMTAAEIQLLRPDLILLDIRIFGYEKTGADICREIRLNRGTKSIPVILLSAERELEKIAIDCNATGHISKPFDLTQLLQKIKELLTYPASV